MNNIRMQTLIRRFRRTEQPRVTVTLYSRVGCHLCDRARNPVERLVATTAGATLCIIDVDTDAALRERYGLRVPVVTATVEGRETVLAEGKVSELWMRRTLVALREA